MLDIHGFYNPRCCGRRPDGTPKPPHHLPMMQAFQKGLRRHGQDMTLGEAHRECDLTICWGWRWKPPTGDFLILENGYIGDTVSAGYNGLNGRADFLNEDVPDDRGRRLYHLLKPYHFGEYTLVMGQVPGDAALQNVDFPQWAVDAAEAARRRVEKPVYFRAHPLGSARVQIPPLAVPLDEALERAHWVITWNSSSAVEAVLAGCPVVAMDRGSMAWDVAANVVDYLPISDQRRMRWLDRLAYCQWTLDEIENGDAWAHLNARYQ